MREEYFVSYSSKLVARRHGFTLTELLVVISIIAVLAGLLIPAVNAAHESARKTTCSNNLRNIGMAILNFETKYQKFPPAATFKYVSGNSGALDDAFPRHSVLVYILPFFEEATLYEKIDLTKHWNDDQPGTNDDNKFWENDFSIGGLLICPSAPRVRFDGNEGFDQHISLNQVSDYVPASVLNAAFSTTQPPINNLEIKPLRDLVTANKIRTTVRGAPAANAPKWQGVIRNASSLKAASVRNADVKDGLSTTMMFFEDAGQPEHNANHKRVFQNPKTLTTFRWANWQMPITINLYCRNGSMMNCENYDEIYSFHNGGSNIVFADGSLHFISEYIDPETFVSLYTMAGGDVVSEQELGL